MQALFTKISWILNTESERSNTYKEILWIQTIQFIEQIALIIPSENQQFFKYDQYSYALIKICSTLLLQFHTHILVILLILFKFLLIFGAFMQKNKDDPLLNWILTYGIFLPSLFYIPQMTHLLFMLRVGEVWVQILSGIGIFVLNLFTIISIYFIRNTLFINKAAIKDWTLLSYLIQFLKLVSCILFVFQEQLIIFKINLGCIYITNIIEIYDIIVNIPFNLYENRYQLSLKMSVFIILLIGSNVVFLENFVILNNSQFLIFLGLGTLGYALGDILHQRLILYRLQTFSQKKSSQRSLKFQLKFIRGVFKQQDSPLKLIYLSFFFQYHNQSCSQNCRQIYEQKSYKFLKKIQLELLNQHQDNQQDDLFIFMLFLYKNEWKSPLLSLMKLKQKIINNKQHTLYFRIKSIALLEKLQLLMKQQYYFNQKKSLSKYKLNPKQILLSYHHEKQILPLFQQLINQKAAIFEEIVTGKMNQGKLEIDMQTLGETVMNITQNLETMVNQKLSNLNLVEIGTTLYIKMLSFYYGVVMNDSVKCQACEHHLYKILLNESLIEGAKFTNRAMHYYKLVVLQVSIVKSQGEIMNSSKLAIGKMLDYDSTEDSNNIKNINEIMPQFIARLHDQMIDEFLNTAQSKYFQEFRQVFALTQQGYVSCLNMQFFNNFSQFDDYVIQTILSKEEEQDLILFDLTGRIQGVSRDVFEELIKPYHKSITLNTFINSYFIYVFIPDIFDVIEGYSKKPTDAAYIQERIFYAKDSQESHNLLLQQNIIHQMASDYLNCPFQTTKRLDLSASTEKMASLLDQDFGKRVQENIKKNNKQQSFIIKFELQLHSMNFSQSSLSYYSLRIIDYNTNQSVDMSQLSSVRSALSCTEQNSNHQKSIRSPLLIIQDYPLSETLYDQKIAIEQKIDQEFQLNSPNQSNGILFVKPIISKPQDDAFLLSIESNSIQQNIKSIQKSNDKFERSEHNISNLTTNRSIENTQFQNFKGFLEIQYISPYVIRLLQIDIVFLILIFVDIIVSMSLIGNTGNLIIQNSKQVTAPLRCNRFFTKAQSLAWLLILQALGMTDQSEYFIQQTTNELLSLEQILPANMTEIMTLFQQMESEQIFIAEDLSLDLLYLKNATTNYTKLMNILQVATISLYKTDFTYTDLTNVKTKDFVLETLLLRYNMKNYFYVNAQLLEALEQSFDRKLNSYELTQLIVLIIEFSILSLITLLQAWNWHMYRFELKQVTKIIGQISIDDAIKEFNKLSHLKFLFSPKQSEVIDWKKQNYFHLMQFNQAEEQIQNSSLSRRNIGNKIKKRNKHIKMTYLLLLFQLCFVGLFFIGSYLLFTSQQTQVKVIQSLSTAYVKFSSSVDVLISSMQIMKTQPLLFEGIIQNNIYTSDEIEQFRDGRKIFTIYNYLSQNFSEKLLDVVKDILDSKTIGDGFKVIYTLYNGDICTVLYDGLPFCQFQDIGESEFIQKYGKFYESDDNREYLSLGIVGMVTRMQKMCNEYFNYESENNEYIQDLSELQQLTLQQDFNNIIFSHFRDSFLAIVTFLNLLLLNLEDVIQKQWINLFIYYLILGIIIESMHIARFLFSLQRGRNQMYKVKLSVCLLPMNYIFSASTQSSIKRFLN